jgi:hypothetical protein
MVQMATDAMETKTEPVPAAPTLQLLAWIAERSRTYPETIEVWKSSCPRLTVWEDALSDGLVRIERGHVLLTAAGTKLLTGQASQAAQARAR